MAEIELGVFIRSCLRQRVPDETALKRHVHALQTECNAAHASIDWCFTTQDPDGWKGGGCPSNRTVMLVRIPILRMAQCSWRRPAHRSKRMRDSPYGLERV